MRTPYFTVEIAMSRHLGLAPLALAALLPSAAVAATGGTPVQLVQSGYLLNAADQPLTTTAALRFRVFDDASAGTMEWEGHCPTVAVTGGYYAVVLGSPACAGIGGAGDSTLDTSDVPAGSPRWIEVQVGAITLLPRQAVTPAASASSALTAAHATNAAHANDADTLGSHPAGDFALASHSHATANATTAGLLSAADWNTFNAKLSVETDPKVGTLTNGKWCTSDGTKVNCASNAPVVDSQANAGLAPATCSGSTRGYLWYDAGSATLKVCDGANYVAVGGGVASSVDTYFSNVSLLTHFEGDFLDVAGHVVTSTGVSISTTDKRYGNSGAVFAQGNYLSVAANAAYAFGTSDFTVELWVKATTSALDGFYRRLYMTDGPTGNATGNFQITLVPGTCTVNLWDGGPSGLDLIGTTSICDGAWHHVAGARQAGVLRLFVDGNTNGSASYAASIGPNGGTPRPWIGAYTAVNGRFAGAIDEVRVTKGVARYTTAFSPPAGAFPNN